MYIYVYTYIYTYCTCGKPSITIVCFLEQSSTTDPILRFVGWSSDLDNGFPHSQWLFLQQLVGSIQHIRIIIYEETCAVGFLIYPWCIYMYTSHSLSHEIVDCCWWMYMHIYIYTFLACNLHQKRNNGLIVYFFFL